MHHRWFTAARYVVLCCGLALAAAGCGQMDGQNQAIALGSPPSAATADPSTPLADSPKPYPTAPPAEPPPGDANLASDFVIVCATPAPYPLPAQPYPPPHTPTPTNTPRPYPLPPTASPAYPAPSTSTPAPTAISACTPGELAQAYPTIIIDRPAPRLGVVIDQNLTVLAVDASSAAERAGVQAGDVLLQIGDVPFVGNREQVKALIADARPNQALRLRLLRGGQPIDLRVELAPMPPPIYPTINPSGPPPPTSTPVPPTDDYL